METYRWHENALCATDKVSFNRRKDNEIFIEECNEILTLHSKKN